MQIDSSDWHDRDYYFGLFEQCLPLLINGVVAPGDTCIDVGAQKGYVSLLLGHRVGPRGRVFSFEPDNRARVLLEEHARRNAYSISAFPFALGETRGICTFTLSSVLGWSSRFPNELQHPTSVGVIEVPTRSVDNLVTSAELDIDLARLSLVKIDAEGSELFILKGMRDLLASADPVLWLEVNPASLAAAGCNPCQIQDFLSSLGFSLYLPEFSRRSYLFPHLTLRKVANLARYPCMNVVAARARIANSAPFAAWTREA